MASRDTPSTPLEPCPKTQGVKRALSCASLSLEEHPRSKHCPVQPGDLGGFDAHALPAGSDDSEWYAAADASGGNVTRGSGCFAASSDIEDSFDGRLIRSLPPLIDDGSWDGDAEDYVEKNSAHGQYDSNEHLCSAGSAWRSSTVPISRAPSEESDSTEQGDRSPSPTRNTMKHGYTPEEEEDRKLRDDRPIEFSAQFTRVTGGRLQIRIHKSARARDLGLTSYVSVGDQYAFDCDACCLGFPRVLGEPEDLDPHDEKPDVIFRVRQNDRGMVFRAYAVSRRTSKTPIMLSLGFRGSVGSGIDDAKLEMPY